jgi:hypothetical protein
VISQMMEYGFVVYEYLRVRVPPAGVRRAPASACKSAPWVPRVARLYAGATAGTFARLKLVRLLSTDSRDSIEALEAMPQGYPRWEPQPEIVS